MSTPTSSPRAPARRLSGRNSGGPRRSRGMQVAIVAISIGLLAVAQLVFFLRSGGGKTGPSKKPVSTNVKLESVPTTTAVTK